MRARIYKEDREAMEALAKLTGKSMSAFAREALSPLLSGDKTHEPPPKPTVLNATFVIPHEMEEGVKALAKDIGVPLDVVVREAIHRTMQELMADRQEALHGRQEALLDSKER